MKKYVALTAVSLILVAGCADKEAVAEEVCDKFQDDKSLSQVIEEVTVDIDWSVVNETCPGSSLLAVLEED